MESTQLGRAGPRTSRIGLGCMGMSDLYGPADRQESLATIHAALEAIVPPNAAAGERYNAVQMAHLGSEMG